LQRRPL